MPDSDSFANLAQLLRETNRLRVWWRSADRLLNASDLLPPTLGRSLLQRAPGDELTRLPGELVLVDVDDTIIEVGLDHECVVNVDSVATIPRELLIRPLGALLQDQERDLTRAFHEAFDLED